MFDTIRLWNFEHPVTLPPPIAKNVELHRAELDDYTIRGMKKIEYKKDSW